MKRYNVNASQSLYVYIENSQGDIVKYEDVEMLEKENKSLKNKIQECCDQLFQINKDKLELLEALIDEVKNCHYNNNELSEKSIDLIEKYTGKSYMEVI